jgi:16S rRNA processing protein RimM
MSDLVAVGKVVGVFGSKGSLRVSILTDFPSRIPRLKSVYLAGGDTKLYQVVAFKRHGRGYNLTVSGVDTREQARALVGSYVSIPEEELEQLPQGTYYGFQVVGSTAVFPDGEKIGEIKDILELPGNDVLVIDRKGEEVLVPLVEAFVKEIDVKEKRVVIEPVKGLIEQA